MNRTGIIRGVVAILLLVACGLGSWWYFGEEPGIAELKQLAEKPPSEETDKAVRNVIREQMQQLPDEQQRRNYFESAAPILIPMFASRFEANYDKFMAMSPEEQRKELDKRIDEMESRQKAGGGGPGGQAGAGGPGGGRRGPMDPKKVDEFRKKMLAYTTPEQRSKFENGVRIFNERRKERGLPPVGRPGGGFL